MNSLEYSEYVIAVIYSRSTALLILLPNKDIRLSINLSSPRLINLLVVRMNLLTCDLLRLLILVSSPVQISFSMQTFSLRELVNFTSRFQYLRDKLFVTEIQGVSSIYVFCRLHLNALDSITFYCVLVKKGL